jgi:hypothetical protein
VRLYLSYPWVSRVTSFPKTNADAAFLRAVDAAQADTLRVSVMQDFNRVAVEDGDDGAGEVSESCICNQGQDRDNDPNFHG